jgi:hypothetical protein
MGYIDYAIEKGAKKLSYIVKDWVVECSGVACADGAIYATDGYGFLCLPRNITQRLADAQYQFKESDAWLDLWCHTVWRDRNNVFSHMSPVVQFGREGVALTLETLGTRWGWEKTKVWRFFQKHEDVFPLRKLPGSYGCLVFNMRYSGKVLAMPSDREILHSLNAVRALGESMPLSGTDNQKINRIIAAYSWRAIPENRVAVPLYMRILLCENCMNCSKDCKRYHYRESYQIEESRCGPPGEYKKCSTGQKSSGQQTQAYHRDLNCGAAVRGAGRHGGGDWAGAGGRQREHPPGKRPQHRGNPQHPSVSRTDCRLNQKNFPACAKGAVCPF